MKTNAWRNAHLDQPLYPPEPPATVGKAIDAGQEAIVAFHQLLEKTIQFSEPKNFELNLKACKTAFDTARKAEITAQKIWQELNSTEAHYVFAAQRLTLSIQKRTLDILNDLDLARFNNSKAIAQRALLTLHRARMKQIKVDRQIDPLMIEAKDKEGYEQARFFLNEAFVIAEKAVTRARQEVGFFSKI